LSIKIIKSAGTGLHQSFMYIALLHTLSTLLGSSMKKLVVTSSIAHFFLIFLAERVSNSLNYWE